MKFAINPITTMKYDFKTSVEAFHAAGITHMELWFDRLEKYLAGRELACAKDLLANNDISPIAGLCMGELMLEDLTSKPEKLAEFKSRLALCRDMGSPVLVIIPESPKQADRSVYANAAKNLRAAAKIASDYNVKLGLEFLQGNKLLGTLSTAKKIIRSVDHPNLGLVLDFSHFWMDRSDLTDIEDLNADELLLVHLEDMEDVEPEAMTDYHRTFPGRGRGIERHLIPAIQATGYDGYWSVEIFNKQIWNQPLDEIVAQTVRSFEYLERNYPAD